MGSDRLAIRSIDGSIVIPIDRLPIRSISIRSIPGSVSIPDPDAVSPDPDLASVTRFLDPAPGGNAAGLLWDAAARVPDAPAFVQRGGEVPYAALCARAAAFARALAEAGARPGDRVAVFLERGADAAAAWFGALAAGAVGVFVNEALRPRQVEYVLDHAGASILVTSGALLARLPRAPRTTARVLDAAVVPGDAVWTPEARAAGEAAMLVYTSGSTGPPKGVALSHASLRACAETVGGYLGLGPSDRTLALLPFSSVYGFNQLLCAVATGGAVVVERSPLAATVGESCRALGVTVLAAVPPLWHALLRAPSLASPVPSLRVVQNAGGHLAPEAVRRLRAAQPQARCFLQYGMTEVMRATFLDPAEVDRRPGCMGRPVAGARVAVVRPDGTECAAGEAGELVFQGPTVALGYWRAPAETAWTFRPWPLGGGPPGARAVFSGDVVRRDADGFLWFAGRRDRMIRSLGYRVGPDEVADALHASGEVAEAVVTAHPDEARGERIVAHVVLRDGGCARRLEAYCRAETPRWMHPAQIRVLDALPRTAAGKYDAAALSGAPA